MSLWYTYAMNKYKVRTITCVGCGKVVTKRMPDGRKYCSLECYRSSARPQRKTGGYVKCEWCSKRVYKPLCQLDNSDNHFCSIRCANAYQGRNRVEFICPVCGDSFTWSKSVLKQRIPKYCSIECRDKDPDYKGHILGNLVQCKKKGLNNLEKAGNKILDDLGIDYKCQVLVENKFIVDVFIPKYKVVIQWDGDYWHGYGKEINNVDDRVKKRMKLDISQDAYMNKCGYRVLRFWEHEVYKERGRISEHIKRAIR